VPSDKIRLYAFDKHPIVLNKGLKLGFHQLKQFVYILLSPTGHLCWIWARNISQYKWWNSFNGIPSKTKLYRNLSRIITVDNWRNSYNYERLATPLCSIRPTSMTVSNSRKSGFGAWHEAYL